MVKTMAVSHHFPSSRVKVWVTKKGVFSFALCLFMSFSLYVLKSHESFTYVSPDVFSASSKSLISMYYKKRFESRFPLQNASVLPMRFFCLSFSLYLQRYEVDSEKYGSNYRFV